MQNTAYQSDQSFRLGVISLMSCSLTSYVVLLKKQNEHCPYIYLILSAIMQKMQYTCIHLFLSYTVWSGKSS